jgi:glycosyltransferase involved in cell wall biosynthesis
LAPEVGSKRTITFFLPSFAGGGAERVMVTLAGTLAARSLKVDLVAGQAVGPCLKHVPPEVRVVDLAARRVLASLPRLVGYLRRERPQAVISALGHANLAALLARDLARTPTRVVITEHGAPPERADHPRPLQSRLMAPLVRPLYRRADGVVAVSRGLALDLAASTGLPPERISVIYNPVVTPALRAAAREPLDHPWFAAGEPPVLLSVGRLTKQKDYPTLIRAFARVAGERPARLLILGEGEDRASLQRLAGELGVADRIALPGFVGNPFAYMARAAALVLSSRWEALPTVLIEALACGCPVVSTDCRSGPREILDDGRWGRLVPVADPSALAAAILQVLTARPEAVAATALHRFEPEHVSRQYLALLQDRRLD